MQIIVSKANGFWKYRNIQNILLSAYNTIAKLQEALTRYIGAIG